MNQKYCTTCGAALTEGLKFCQQCGSPVVSDLNEPLPHHPLPPQQPSRILPVTLPQGGGGGRGKMIIVAAVVILIIAVALFFFVLPLTSGSGNLMGELPGSVTTTQTIAEMTKPSLPKTPAATTAPTQKTDPFPNAFGLNDRLPFGTGSVSSEATVYRIWINDTYEWHNDMDNHYYVEKAKAGSKFLFVFVHLQNNGDTRVWFPPAGNVIVYNNGIQYTEDRSHYKPDKLADEEATPVEVKEIQYYQKLNGDEYVEDFGFSHGTELAYLYPGASNAVDGYIIYEVPQSLIPEETYVIIPFNAQDQGVWKLG